MAMPTGYTTVSVCVKPRAFSTRLRDTRAGTPGRSLTQGTAFHYFLRDNASA